MQGKLRGENESQQELPILGSSGRGPVGNRIVTLQELPSGTKRCKMCIWDTLSAAYIGFEAILARTPSPHTQSRNPILFASWNYA